MLARCIFNRNGWLSIGMFLAVAVAWQADSAQAECHPAGLPIPICLSGTAIAPGYAGALVGEEGKSGLLRVNQGDMIDDWSVQEIGARYIVMEKAGQTVRLDIDDAGHDEFVRAQQSPEHAAPRPKGPMMHARSLARGDGHE
jgi:hypothetical protein